MYTEDGNIQLDHALNITAPGLSASLERSLNKALKSFERACTDISKSIRIVGYAAAAYLIMAGVSKLMEARYKSLPPSQLDDEKHNSMKIKKRDKKKSRKVTGKDGKEEWEETQEWEKELEADPSVLDNLP